MYIKVFYTFPGGSKIYAETQTISERWEIAKQRRKWYLDQGSSIYRNTRWCRIYYMKEIEISSIVVQKHAQVTMDIAEH